MDTQAAPSTALAHDTYRQDIFSTLLRWSTAICGGIAAVLIVAYLRTPVWTLLLLTGGFALFACFSWWSIGRVTRATLDRIVYQYLAQGITLMALAGLFTQETLLLESAMGLMIFILLAALLEPMRKLVRWTALCAALYVLALLGRWALPLPAIDFGPLALVFFLTVPPVLFALTAMLGLVIIQHLRVALRKSESDRRRLAAAYAEVEQRTRDLLVQREALEATLETLRQTQADHVRLAQTVQGMSMPLLPVLEGVLVMPVIGVLDEQGLRGLQETLLGAIQRQRARTVIVDLTGLVLVDDAVAQGLLRLLRAMRLLGAHPIMVGITPEIAQSLVQLGQPLDGVVTMANLQAAVASTIGTHAGPPGAGRSSPRPQHE